MSPDRQLPSSGTRALLLCLLVFATGCGSSVETAVPDGPRLRVCLPEDDPPRSRRASASGLDVDVGRLLAAKLARPLAVFWAPSRVQTDIESSDRDYRPLLQRTCDVMLSVPGAAEIAPFQDSLILSVPYYGATWEVIPHDADFDWRQPYTGKVAVQAFTVGHRAVDAWDLDWTMQADADALLHAVRTGTADIALVWGPDLAGRDIERKADFDPPPALRWNLHAALRREDAELASAIDAAFSSPDVRQAVGDLLAQHGVPRRGPFDTVHSLAALNAL